MRAISVVLCAALLLAVPLHAQEPPNLLANGDFAQGLEGWWISPGETHKEELAAADLQGARQALHLTVSPAPNAKAWDISCGYKVNAALRSGSVYRLQLWARSPQSCRLTVLLQLGQEPWSTLFGRTLTLTPKWQQYTLLGRLQQDYPAGGTGLSLQAAHDRGQLDVAQLTLADLGPDASDTPPPAPANPLKLIPFVLPWDDASPGVTDVSGWLDKPAGARGFVTARDGHLYSGDRRVRFLGTNICTSAAFPDHATAEKVAGRLAKFGINCVRFHHMDAPWITDGILQADKRTLDPAQLERLDYFIAQLKARGIYTDLNLHVSRVYPGFPTESTPEFFKGLDNFFPPMIAMQRDYARELLTHVNPYTKAKYAEEPAVAIIEINNENGLLSQWQWGGLDSMPELYREELARQWNAWLKGRYADQAALLKAWDLIPRPLGAELLANGGFARGTEGWVLENNGTAQATMAAGAVDGRQALTLDVRQIDDQGWHVQLLYPGLQFAQDGVYTLELEARADSPRTVSLDARMAHEPWQTLWSTEVKLTPEWQHLKYAISVPVDESNGRISLSNLGAATGQVQVAAVSLRPGGGYELPAGQTLGTLAAPTRSDFSGTTEAMRRDWLGFLYETENAYWQGMAKYLKEDLGCRPPIVGSAAGFSPLPIQAQLDVVDTHAYWQHPRFPGRPWDGENWVLPNLPMAGVRDGGVLPGLARSRVVGKPFLVTEYNHPAPNTHNAESFLLAAAYAGLQDWDGIFSFAYEGGRDSYPARRLLGYFDVEHHPTQMATMPAAAALLLRGDLTPPTDRLVAPAGAASGEELVRRFGSWFSGGNLGLTAETALQRPVAVDLASQAAPPPPAPPAPDRLGSTGGAWVWDRTKGREHVLINTPRSRGAIGSIAAAPFALGGVTVAPGKNLQDWAAIMLTAVDGAEVTAPGRVLITAVGYAENTSMGWKNEEKSTVGTDWGREPTLVEGVPATITLPLPAARVTAYALDERGQRGEKVAVTEADGKAVVTIGPQYKTLWYEVEVRGQ